MKKQLHLLLIEDSEDDAFLLLKELERQGYEVVADRIATREEMAAALENEECDAIVSDYFLPRFGALEALRLLKGEELDLPFVVVSGKLGEELAVEAMKDGAHDYVAKDKLARLGPVIERELRQAEVRRAQRRAEEALRESEGRFRATFEQAAVGVAHVDLDGRWLRVNKKLCGIVGYAEDELLMLTFQDITHPDDLDADLRHLDCLLAGEIETYSMEKRYFRGDGSTVWVNLTVSLVVHEGEYSDTPEYLVSVIEDITERKQAEERLRESEDRYRVVAETASDAIVIIDEDSRIEFVNGAAEKTFGYARAEMLGQQLTTLMPKHLREGYRASLKRYLETGRRHLRWDRVRLPGLHKSGKEISLEISFGEFTREGRRFFTGFIRDITERQQIEEALRQSEELYRTVVEQAAENIFLVDLETKLILEANATFHRSLGYTTEELRCMTLYDVVAHDPESINWNVRRVVDGNGGISVGERQYRRKDGSVTDVEVSASTISYSGKEVMCIVAHDVTERKRMEDNLRHSLDIVLALHEGGQILASSLDLEEIGSKLLRNMQRVSGLATAVISVPDEQRRLRVWRAIGFERLWRRARYAPKVQAVLHEVLDTGEYRSFRLEPPEGDAGSLVGLCLPLRIQNRSIGLLEVYGPGSLLEGDTVEILGSMTVQAASALENARLYGELAERENRLENLIGRLLAAQEEERRRVAYEVHDDLAQVAATAHQRLQTFARRYPPASEKGGKDLGRILGLVQQTVGEARRIIANLRPEALDDFGLAAALYQEVEKLRNDGWQVDYEEEFGDERLPARVEVALFRIAQEALTNACKHAQTHRARLELLRREGAVSLEVRDWGCGFDPDALVNGEGGPGERIGLSGMRERVGLLGGEFEVRSSPGEGTSIRARVPLPVLAKNDEEDERGER